MEFIPFIQKNPIRRRAYSKKIISACLKFVITLLRYYIVDIADLGVLAI